MFNKKRHSPLNIVTITGERKIIRIERLDNLGGLLSEKLRQWNQSEAIDDHRQRISLSASLFGVEDITVIILSAKNKLSMVLVTIKHKL